MKPDDERLARLHEALVERVQEVVSGDDFIRFVAESDRFHRYSARNRLLIAVQLIDRGVEPEGLTASYRTWTRVPAEGGGTCQVAKGEKALWIYAPLTVTRRVLDDETGDERVVAAGLRGFKPVAVFHHSQLTSPPVVPEPPMPKLLRGPDAPVRVWDGVVAELEELGYSVSLVPRARGATWNGQTSFASHTVDVQDDLEPPQRLKTLFHEWAHATMDHEHRVSDSDRRVSEVEAESVAYLLSNRVGVDSEGYTVPYVSAWAGSAEIVKATAERVLSSTSRLIGRLETRLGIELDPDVLALAQAGAQDPTVEDGLARAGARLLSAERAELLGAPAPVRVASLLAAAGLDAASAADTFRQLGVDRDIASTAMTSIHPFTDIDRPAESLFEPAEVHAALSVAYGPSPADRNSHGLRLIDRWTEIVNSPAIGRTIPMR